MPTTKTRINLSVTPELTDILEKIAARDQVSLSAKTLELVRIGLELEEDLALLEQVHPRDKSKSPFLSHGAVWG